MMIGRQVHAQSYYANTDGHNQGEITQSVRDQEDSRPDDYQRHDRPGQPKVYT
jgi:hypothetical protein